MSSTIQRYRNDINMLSPYRISLNNTKKRSKKAKIDDIGDLKRPQMTSDDSKTTSNDLKTTQTKSNKKKKYSLKLDLCRRILRLTNTIWIKFLKIITYEYFYKNCTLIHIYIRVRCQF